MVKLKGPENCGGFSYDGVSYQADEDGIIDIPAGDAVKEAYSHGFTAVTEKPARKPLAKVEKPVEKLKLDEKPEDEKPAKEDAPKAVKGGK